MKRLISLLMAALMLLTLVPVTAMAANFTVWLEPSTQEVSPGDTDTVEVMLAAENVPDFAGFQVIVTYDTDVLEPVEGSWQEWNDKRKRYDEVTGDYRQGYNLGGSVVYNKETAGEVSLVYSDTVDTVWDMEEPVDTELVTIFFKVKDNAANGDTALTISTVAGTEKWVSISETLTSPTYVNTSITVTGGTAPHTHSLTKHEANDATCDAAGNTLYYSCTCGKYFSDAAGTVEINENSWVLPALNHKNATKTENKPATCTEDGENAGYWFCPDCNKYFDNNDGAVGAEAKEEDVVIDALNHKKATKTPAVTPTCMAGGNYAYWYCDDCKTYFEDNEDAIGAATTLEKVTIAVDSDAHNFDESKWEKSETQHWYACKNGCGEKNAVADHSWEVVKTDATDTGHKVVCTVCGYEKTEDHAHDGQWQHDGTHHWKTCGCGTVVDKAAHRSTGDNVATCNSKAKCDDCGVEYGGYVYTNHAGTLTETPAVAATCVAKGNVDYWTCSACHKNFSDAEGKNILADVTTAIDSNAHNMDTNWTTEGSKHFHKCLNEGCTHKEDEADCSGGTATCQAKAVCSVCNKEYGDFAAHNYGEVGYTWAEDNSTCTAERTCQTEGCGYKETETATAVESNVVAATCKDKGSKTMTATFQNTAFETQTKTGVEIAIDPAKHTGLDHTSAKAATCTEKGNIEYWYCSGCGNYYSDAKGAAEIANGQGGTEVPPLGHVWSHEWSSDGTNHWHVCTRTGCTEVEPGSTVEHTMAYHATQDGAKHYQECSVCHYKTAEADHDYNVVSDEAAGHHQHCTSCGHDTQTVAHNFDNNDCTQKGTCGDCRYERAAGQHTGDIKYTWLSNETAPTQCKAELTCTSCSTKIEQTVAATSQTTAATCVAKGSTVYTAVFDTVGLAGTKTLTVELPVDAANHAVALTATAAKDPTCTANGNSAYWYCESCHKYFSDAAGTTVIAQNSWVIPATGHKYGDPAWTWTEYTGATATFTCTNGTCGDAQKVTAKITNAVTTAATCEADGVRTYTAKVTFGGNTYSDTKTETIAATGHTYGTVKWSWANDGKSATASVTCGKCTAETKNHTLTGEAVMTDSVKTPATCEAMGTTTYTATITLDKEYTATKDVKDIPALGHTWNAPDFVWTKSGSGYTCKATFICATDSKHTKTIACTVTKDEVNSKAPNCTEDGQNVYVAKVTFDQYQSGAEVSETKTDVLTKLGHQWAAAWTSDGTQHWHVCTREGCGAVDAKENHVSVTESDVAATCNASGHKGDTYCSVCGAITQHGDTIPATGEHNYGDDGKCTVCGNVNPVAGVEPTNVAKATSETTVGGKTVKSELAAKLVADTTTGLVLKSETAVDETKVTEIQTALTAGSTVTKVDNSKTKQIAPAEDGGEAALTALANNAANGEEKAEIEKLADAVKQMVQSDNTKDEVQVELVLDITAELLSADKTPVAELIELPAAITVRIPISAELYTALQGKTVAVLRSHTGVDGEVETTELPATLGHEGDNYYVEFASDQFSTFALISYESVGSHHHSSSSSTPSGKSFTTSFTGITAVYVDGKKLDSKYYTVSGSTVTLTDAFLATLKAGSHTFKAESATMVGKATFQVARDGVLSAKTGDMGLGMWYAMLTVSALLGAALVVKKRREA